MAQIPAQIRTTADKKAVTARPTLLLNFAVKALMQSEVGGPALRSLVKKNNGVTQIPAQFILLSISARNFHPPDENSDLAYLRYLFFMALELAASLLILAS